MLSFGRTAYLSGAPEFDPVFLHRVVEFALFTLSNYMSLSI